MNELEQGFQGKKNKNVFFLLTKYMIGGTLKTRLIKEFCFDEETTKFYAACIACGLQYFHEQNIVYRDLSLIRILVDEQGYPCLSDFGLPRVLSIFP